MKIRNRLTLLSSVTYGIVFIVASFIIYLSFYRNSEKIILNELQKTCLLSGVYYLEKDELPEEEHSQVKDQFEESIQDITVRIYNEKNEIRYGEKEPDRNINKQRLDYVRKHNKINFKSNNHFYFGLFYADNQGDFVVFVKTNNKNFKEQTNQLLFIMIVVLIGGLIIIYIFSRILSDFAYRPITNVINQVNEIEANSLDRPIISTNTKDEVQALIDTFNNLLKRLSDTFIIQKNFINYVSHEFKTPLASISGTMEVFNQKERTPQEYNQVTKKVLEDVYYIESILTTLMMLSGLKDTNDNSENFRVDELIWDINEDITENNTKKPKIKIHLDIKNDRLLNIKGNKTQIYLALYNIIENAIKYSDKSPIEISLFEKNNKLEIIIKDYGKGINKNDLKHIHQTFYRGANVENIKGNGIGLSLATIIFKQNNIGFLITSKEHYGTTVILNFP